VTPLGGLFVMDEALVVERAARSVLTVRA